MGYHKYTSNTLSILCLNVGLALSSVSVAAAQTLEPEPPSENPKGYPRICTSSPTAFATVDPCKIYKPRFELWSDGAAKERFIALPDSASEKIDFSDPERWNFPVGTRLYKNFMEKDGKTLLESRVITKVAEGPGYNSWNFKSYRWNGNSAEPTLVLNVNGEKNFDNTSAHKNIGDLKHDIPAGRDCKQCHDLSGKDPVLGFQAIQLKGAPLYSLTDVPNVPPSIKDAAGITGSDVEVDAIGYLHGNCGTCHAPGKQSPVFRAEIAATRQPIMDQIGNCEEEPFELNRGDDPKAPYGLDEFTAGLHVTAKIEPGKPENSYLYARMSTRKPGLKMPLIASKVVDEDGMTKVRNWIKSLTDPALKRCAAPTPPVETTEPTDPTEPGGDEPFEEGEQTAPPAGEEQTDPPVGEAPTDEPEGEQPDDSDGDEQSGESEGEDEEPFEDDPFGLAANISSAHSRSAR